MGDMMSYENWNYFSEADFDRDGDVDQEDLAALDQNFGRKGAIDE